MVRCNDISKERCVNRHKVLNMFNTITIFNMCKNSTVFILPAMLDTAFVQCSFSFTHIASTTPWAFEMVHNKRFVEKGCFIFVIAVKFELIGVIKKLEFNVGVFLAVTFDFLDASIS